MPSFASNRHMPLYFSAIALTDSVPSPVPGCFVEASSPFLVDFNVPLKVLSTVIHRELFS